MCSQGKGETVQLSALVGYYAHESSNTVWYRSPGGVRQVVCIVSGRHSAAHIALVLEADRRERIERALAAQEAADR